MRYADNSKMTSYSMAVLVGIGFLYMIITFSFSTPIYLAALFAAALVYVVSQGTEYSLNVYSTLWLFALLILVANFLVRPSGSTVYMDFIVLIVCTLMVLFVSKESSVYEMAVKTIKVLSLFFALSVFLQLLAPGVFNQIVGLFPVKLKNMINPVAEYKGAIQGFSPNVGFTAGVIIAGIIAFCSEKFLKGRLNIKERICLLILVVALLFTAKRGPTLFLIISLFALYFISAGIMEKRSVARKILIAFTAIIVVAFMIASIMPNVPLFNYLSRTLDSIQSGSDATSGRMGMYTFALQLFAGNPIFGIGWDNYINVYEAVKGISGLQTHNVYLQLLCETGIIGFIVFILLFIASWVLAKNAYIESLNISAQEDSTWKKLLFFALGYQTYFLLYSLTGNPLYDDFFIIMYGFSCAIPLAFRRFSEKSLL